MVSSFSPIGKFILLSYQSPGVLEADSNLQNKLDDLVAILIYKVQEKGIEFAQKSLEEQLFSFRFEILEYLVKHPDILEEFENTIIDQIGNKYFTKGKFKALGNTVSDTLEVYLSMFEKITSQIKSNLPSIEPITDNLKQELAINSLRHIYTLQPTPELFILIEWFTASVRYDFYLIAAEFIILKKITVPEEQIKILSNSIKQAIIDFGTYTTLSGIWQPNVEDESQLIRNIKIKTAATKLKLGLSNKVELPYLQNIINS